MALHRSLCETYGLHRYGFHGLAHAALWWRWRELSRATKSRVISLQLGSAMVLADLDAAHDGSWLEGQRPVVGSR